MANNVKDKATPATELTQPPEPLPPLIPSPLPIIKKEEDAPSARQLGDAPREEEYSGLFVHIHDDPMKGEEFALAVVSDDPRGRTHFARNSIHMWNGTEEEFKLQFEKK